MPQTRAKDKGYKKLIGELKKLNDTRVKVGHFDDRHPSDDGMTTVAQIAYWNHNGTKGPHGIPPRPWATRVLRGQSMRIKMDQMKLLEGIAARKITTSQASNIFGNLMVGRMQVGIETLRDPKNADSTLAGKKPRTNPLINTGFMRRKTKYRLYVGPIRTK